MAPWHSAKHQREAWGGIGGAALAPELRWHRRELAGLGFLLPWATHGGRGTLPHLHERKAPREAGGPTGGTGRDGEGRRCRRGSGHGAAPAPAPRTFRPTRGQDGPAASSVTPPPGKAGTSEEPGHQAGPELFNVIAQERVRCLPLFYVLHV